MTKNYVNYKIVQDLCDTVVCDVNGKEVTFEEVGISSDEMRRSDIGDRYITKVLQAVSDPELYVSVPYYYAPSCGYELVDDYATRVQKVTVQTVDWVPVTCTDDERT